MEHLSKRQKQILELLLDRYEGSKTYEGQNRVTQHFRVRPAEIWPDYEDPFTDVGRVEDFNREAERLERLALLTIEREKSGEIRALTAVAESFPLYYRILEREDRQELLRREMEMYRTFADDGTALGGYCRSQLELLEQGRKANYRKERAQNYITLMRLILENDQEMYERELSIRVFHDSKVFEQSYRRTVCTLLRKYGDYEEVLQGEEDPRIIQMLILETHQIYANPGYVYIKGAASLLFSDGGRMELRRSQPLALSADFLSEVTAIQPEAGRVITIENLTAFHRFDEEGAFCVFLSGYHSLRKVQLLKKIVPSPDREWLHFGDLDPDGFMILRNLQRKTGLDFRPYRMDAGILEENMEYTKPLEEQDRVKARTLIREGFCVEVLEYLLETGRKLEQEALSFIYARSACRSDCPARKTSVHTLSGCFPRS